MMEHSAQIWIRELPTGKHKASYRTKLITGEWEKHWHHLTVNDAKKLLKDGCGYLAVRDFAYNIVAYER